MSITTRGNSFEVIADMIEGLGLNDETLRRWTCEVVADCVLEHSDKGVGREDVVKVLYHRTESSSHWAIEFEEMSRALGSDYHLKLEQLFREIEELPGIPPAQIPWDVIDLSLDAGIKQQIAKYFVLRDTVERLFRRELPRRAGWFAEIEHSSFTLDRAWSCLHLMNIAADKSHESPEGNVDYCLRDRMWFLVKGWSV